MANDSDPRLGVGRLAGPIITLIAGALLVLGVLAERSSPGEIAGGPGFPFYIFGTLAAFVGVSWSLVVLVIALAELVRRTNGGRRAAKTLGANAAAPLGAALFVLVVWLTNTS